jgi:hypothetical protein
MMSKFVDYFVNAIEIAGWLVSSLQSRSGSHAEGAPAGTLSQCTEKFSGQPFTIINGLTGVGSRWSNIGVTQVRVLTASITIGSL